MIKKTSFGDNHFQIAQCTQIFERIFCSDNHVSAFSFFDRSGNVTNSGKFSTSLCCSIDGKGIGYANIFMKIIEFTPEIILGNPWATNIIAQNNRNVICECSFRTVNNALEDDVSIILSQGKGFYPVLGQKNYPVDAQQNRKFSASK